VTIGDRVEDLLDGDKVPDDTRDFFERRADEETDRRKRGIFEYPRRRLQVVVTAMYGVFAIYAAIWFRWTPEGPWTTAFRAGFVALGAWVIWKAVRVYRGPARFIVEEGSLRVAYLNGEEKTWPLSRLVAEPLTRAGWRRAYWSGFPVFDAMGGSAVFRIEVYLPGFRDLVAMLGPR